MSSLYFPFKPWKGSQAQNDILSSVFSDNISCSVPRGIFKDFDTPHLKISIKETEGEGEEVLDQYPVVLTKQG